MCLVQDGIALGFRYVAPQAKNLTNNSGATYTSVVHFFKRHNLSVLTMFTLSTLFFCIVWLIPLPTIHSTKKSTGECPTYITPNTNVLEEFLLYMQDKNNAGIVALLPQPTTA